MIETREVSMKRNLVVFSCLLAILFGVPSLLIAGTVTIFEKAYLKPVGKPLTYSDTFSVPANVDSCLLVVKNGLDGSSEVQNVYVWVNNVQVFGHRDFKKTATADAAVELSESNPNTITVTLQGQGSTFITVEVIGQQQTSPPTTPPPFDPGDVDFF
jgi:hypothetical protein